MKGTAPAVIWTAAALLLLAIPVAAQIGGRPQRPKVQRPDGPVWEVIRTHCTACHGIDDFAFYAQDKAAWQKLIAQKHKPGEADLSDADRALLLDWLGTKFGPDTKPFPRTYVPREITTFFSDPEAIRLLNRACTQCHALEQVQTATEGRGGLAGHAFEYAGTGRPTLGSGTRANGRVARPSLGNQRGQVTNDESRRPRAMRHGIAMCGHHLVNGLGAVRRRPERTGGCRHAGGQVGPADAAATKGRRECAASRRHNCLTLGSSRERSGNDRHAASRRRSAFGGESIRRNANAPRRA